MKILITGGASGLGLAITKALAVEQPDAKIYFTFFSAASAGEQLARSNENLEGIRCDFRNAADVAALAAFVASAGIEILINNALTGIDIKHFHKLDAADFNGAFKNDVLPVLLITGAFIRAARIRKSGKIITVLSANIAKTPPLGLSVYVANKNYLLSMHKSWASENKGFNITSNCISPEFMATPLNESTDPRVIENMVEKHPLKKLLTAEEVAETVVFLCSASGQLNGQNIIINAGGL